MTTIKIAKIYNGLLEETKVKGIFTRNGKEFFGPLFWEKDEEDEVKEILAEVTILDGESEEAEVSCVIDEYIELAKKHGLKVFKDTEKTMKHWQFMNGFSNVIFDQ